MELFDLLETRVVELLGQIDTLREENKTLQEKVNALDEENKTLKESLAVSYTHLTLPTKRIV